MFVDKIWVRVYKWTRESVSVCVCGGGGGGGGRLNI